MVTIGIMWASAVVACVVVVSASSLRRWPLPALALLVAIPVVASTMDAMRLGLGLLVLFYAAAGIEVSLIAPSVTRRLIEQFARAPEPAKPRARAHRHHRSRT